MLVLRAPGDADLGRRARSQRSAPLTYEGVGQTLAGVAPAGFHLDRYERRIGGAGSFDGARAALADWRPQRGSGIRVWADGPVVVGTTVALAAPLPVGFVIACCRIVAVVDEPDRFGFAYGTLPLHPESGEELFLVERIGDDVVFRIVVFWRPHQLLARVGVPVARRLQRSATHRYLEAMEQPPPC